MCSSDLYWKSAVDELLWIWQKKSNRICDLGSHVWDEWAGEDGTIGKAYGYQLGVKHQFANGQEPMDQVDRVLYDLKHNPASRRILTNIYNFQDLHEMNLYPCAYSMTFNVTGDTLNGILNQRSQDMLTANNWNVVQYSVLMHMMAQVSGLKVGELVHVIADCHIYDRHIPAVKAMLEREGFPAPTFKMDKSITDFYAFTKDSFKMENYQFHPFDFEIPMAIYVIVSPSLPLRGGGSPQGDSEGWFVPTYGFHPSVSFADSSPQRGALSAILCEVFLWT